MPTPYTPRPKREVTCETCGKTAHTHARNWRFCSPRCKDAFWNRSLSCTKCGVDMWRGSTNAAVMVCHDCRAANVEHGRASTYKQRGCRCDLCRTAWNEQCRKYQKKRERITRSCVECSAEFNPRANQITCSPVCRKAYLGRLGHNATRAAYFGVDYELIDRLEVFEADGWTCGICSLAVDPAAKYPEPGAPTLDHVVPMSRGGAHVRANVQLAHFYCNTVKGARLEEAC